MGLARFVRAGRTPLSAGDTSPRRRPRASGRPGGAPVPAGPAVVQAHHHQHHDTPPERPAGPRRWIIMSPERLDQRRRRRNREPAAHSHIHHRGPEPQGHPSLVCPAGAGAYRPSQSGRAASP